jgi:signal transduction histidine kinase
VVGTVGLVSVAALARAAMTIDRSGIVIAAATLPVSTGALLWRRSHPAAVLTVLACAFTVSTAAGWPQPQGFGLIFGVYAAALYGDRRVRAVAGSFAVAALALSFGVMLDEDTALALAHLTGMTFGYGVAWVLGDHTRIRHAYLAELTERAARLERERDEYARRAIEEERGRIARDLHDVVAHNVSVIAVQAGAARVTAQSNLPRAIQALAVIERTARGTLTELRILLGMLRKSGTLPPLRHPRPTLERLDELVRSARDAGLRLETRVHGDARALPSIVDLCAYRVIQEALTNAIKHAPAATVHLTVHYGADELAITIVDDGPGPTGTGTVGHGLIGMRERVALVGGDLRVGPAPGGGFLVGARLPVDGDPAAADAVLIDADHA